MNRIIERYEAALRTIPPPGGAGCHTALLGCANLGIMAGVPEFEIMANIRAAIPQGERHVNDREIAEAVSKASSEIERGQMQGHDRQPYKPIPPPPPPFDGHRVRQQMIEESRGATDADLWEASPYRLDGEPGQWDAVTILETLYAPHETLFAGGTYDKQVRTIQALVDAFRGGGAVPPHIILNPLTGEEVETADGKLSFRCDAAVLAFRFALVEFDNMPMPDQFSFWHTVVTRKLLPVAALIHSGGKSIHAWIRVNLPDRAAWDQHVKRGLYDQHTGRMALLGADRACQNPARLSRMPGHFRHEKTKWQQIIYLNPKAGEL